MEDTREKSSRWPLYAALGIIILAAALFFLFSHRSTVWTNDAYIDGYQISISPDIEARIIELYVDEGDAVVTGQLLCQLDESIYSSQKRDAETNVSLLAEKVRYQKVLEEKQRDIYRVAQQEYENSIISFIEYDKIEKDYRSAEAAFRVEEAALFNGMAKLGVIEELLAHTKVYAPRDGFISKRWVVAGDVAHFGQPLFSLTDPNIWITANLEEYKIQHLKEGDPVSIHIDAYPHLDFSGSIFVVRAATAGQFSLIPPDNATGNFTKVVQRVPVKIWLDQKTSQKNLYLYPGMSVEIRVKYASK
jgi:membrane fusion protein (multidrug efflux system)